MYICFMKTPFLSFLILLAAFTGINGQSFSDQSISEAAIISYSLDTNSFQAGDQANLIFEVQPKENWHIYSAKPSEDGASEPTSLNWEITSQGFEAKGELQESGRMTSIYDDIMEGILRYYKEKFTFSQPIQITESQILLVGTLDYMACNEFKCIPLMAEFKVNRTSK